MLIHFPIYILSPKLINKVDKVLESAKSSSKICTNICKAVQNDMKKKTQIEKMILLAEYIKTLKELEIMFYKGRLYFDCSFYKLLKFVIF